MSGLARQRVACGLLAGLLVAACHTHPGDRCKSDSDCGSGFDCWQERCTRVCTATEQCGPGEACVRYRCTALAPAPGAAGDGPGHAGAPSTAAASPASDETAAELRAIRHELELLRAEQRRILEAIEKNGQGPAADGRRSR